jgi:hypothetical protein
MEVVVVLDVGLECWVYVIFFACVCVGASDSTTMSDDPSSSSMCVVYVELFLEGSQGGQVWPPWLRTTFGATPQNFFWAVFFIFSEIFLFLAVF